MWTADDRDPPTTPSARGPAVRSHVAAIEIQDAPQQEATPSTRGRFLFALMRRLRELSPRDLPAMSRAVLVVMADFTDVRGIAWPAVSTVAKTAGMAENTARRAIEALVKNGWLILRQEATPRTTARYEVRTDGRPFPAPPERGAALRGPTGEPLESGVPETHPRGAGEGPQGCNPGTSGVQERDLRGAAVGPDPLNYPLSDPHNYPPTEAPIARTGARAGTPEAKVQGDLFGRAEPPTAEAAATKPRRSPSPRKRAARPRWRDYADLFVAGVADAGVTISALSEGEATTIGRAAATHAVGLNGKALVGPDLDAWIRKTATGFARAGGNLTAWNFKTYCDRVFGGAKGSAQPARAAPIRVQPGGIASGVDPAWDEED